MSEVIKFNIPGKPMYLQTVRLAIGSLATQAGFDVEKVDDIQVAVEEACKFIACHGHEGFSESYDIEAEIVEKGLEITVSDFCSCGLIDKEHSHFCARCPEEGNMSMFVIDTLMDHYETEIREDGSKKIKMVKNK